MPKVLEGYRELESGEIIDKTDLFCPNGSQIFRKFLRHSNVPGQPYKDKQTKLLPFTTVIRKVKTEIKEDVNIFCKNAAETREDANLLFSLASGHPVFSKYRTDGPPKNYQKNFYILTNFRGTDRNYFSFTDTRDKSLDSSFINCRDVSKEELFKILGYKEQISKFLSISSEMVLNFEKI